MKRTQLSEIQRLPQNLIPSGYSTVVALTKIIANTPDYWVLRQLDDTLVVSPCDTNHTVQFISSFNVVCNNLAIPQPLCAQSLRKLFRLQLGVQSWGLFLIPQQ